MDAQIGSGSAEWTKFEHGVELTKLLIKLNLISFKLCWSSFGNQLCLVHSAQGLGQFFINKT